MGNACRVSIEENNHDKAISLSRLDEKRLLELEETAFRDCLDDPDVAQDAISNISESLRLLILDTEDCNPYSDTATLRDVQFNAAKWQTLVNLVRGQFNLEERAMDLFAEEQLFYREEIL